MRRVREDSRRFVVDCPGPGFAPVITGEVGLKGHPCSDSQTDSSENAARAAEQLRPAFFGFLVQNAKVGEGIFNFVENAVKHGLLIYDATVPSYAAV